MANIPLQYPFPYKTINSTGFTSSVEFVNVTVLGDVTIDQNLTVSGNITTTDLTVGDDLTVGGQIDAQVLRAYGIWDVPTATVTGAGSWIGFDASGHTIFANRKSTVGQSNSFRWHAYDHTNAFSSELMRLSSAGNLFVSGTRIEFPLIHFTQPAGTYPNYDFILPTAMGSSGQVLTSAGAGNPTYWTTPSGGGGGGGTVTNVSAGTMPSFMSMTITSPSTTPIINISSSSTGSNNVVLQTGPVLKDFYDLSSVSGTAGYLRLKAVSNVVYIETGTSSVNDTAADLVFTTMNAFREWMRLTAAGYVGIGTAAPNSKLHISGNDQVTMFEGTSNVYIGYSIAGNRRAYMGFGNAVDKDFTIYNEWSTGGGHIILGSNDPAGLIRCTKPIFLQESVYLKVVSNNLILDAGTNNVGIGTTNPLYKITISGDDSGPADLSGALCVQSPTDTNQRLHMGYATAGNYSWIESVQVGTDLTPLSLQPRGGFVGIGTTTPTRKLTVSDDNTSVIRFERTGAGRYDAEIGLFNNGDFQIQGGADGTTLTEFLRILGTNGNVGIGTSTPAAKLSVIGSVLVQNNGQTLVLKGTDHCYLRFNYGGVDKGYLGYGSASSTNLTLYNQITNGDVYVGAIGTGKIYLENSTTITGTCRATNFTTNGTNTFTYEHGNFTPRLMAYRRATGLAYELSASLPSASITASYSVQTGRYVRIGQNLTINVELRWTISTGGLAPDDYDMFVWIPDGFNPNTVGVVGPCLNYPNSIGGITNPMGTLAQYPAFNAGGNVCAIFPTTGTGTIAYPIFAPGGTQVLQFAMTYVIN